MSELDKINKNITTLVGSDVVQTGNVQLSNLFNIHLDPGDPNFDTFISALEKCAIAAETSDMDITRQMVISANDLGNRIETKAVDASLMEGWENSQRFKRTPNGAEAWQEREIVPTSHQLNPAALQGKEMVVVSRDLTPLEASQSKKVLEVVAVTREEQPILAANPNPTNELDEERANSHFFLPKDKAA